MISTDDAYEDIIQRGRRNEARITLFLKNLRKNRRLPLETLFADAHHEAFSEIDCLQCGRCCRGLGPRLREKDVARLARREKLKLSAFVEQRLRQDEDGDMVYASMPCPYLGLDGYCLVYEDRPEACRNYPHMNSGRQKARIAMHIENLVHCPAVVRAVEYLMDTVAPGK